ncbi:MAG TPA: hypothetical protein PKA16_01040 [Ottowia sp.]|uniref:hypothetical protein n=1 Tax=Ottowia sp. TaxID=1898956 RepID=UPI002BED3B02|nr:hypothetical protein [Ottowia sp.]HMN19956.1 hypothetical protein [Ottowia sp.]
MRQIYCRFRKTPPRFTGILLLSLSCTMPGIVGAAECDTRLQPIEHPMALAYRDRGDHCDGLYRQPVATTGLRIIGFQANRIQSTNANGIGIHVEAPGLKRLTIESLRRRQYYRFDKNLPEKDYYYAFDLVNHPAIKLEPDEIAARVCLERCETMEPVLAPVSFSIPGGSRPDQPFITLQATEDLTMMRVEIRASNGAVLLSKDVLQDRNWPAWRPAVIPLADFFAQAPQLTLRVTARGRGLGQVDAVAATLLSSAR